jgi:hypothetical protein
MSERERLPQRRRSESFSFTLGDLKYTATIGHYPNGRVGEIFLSNSKPSSMSDAYARDAAVAASLALQHGCSIETLQRAVLRDANGQASTPLGTALDIFAGGSGQ